MRLSELRTTCMSELVTMGKALEIEDADRMRKPHLVFAIVKKRAGAGERVFGDGLLRVMPGGSGFLRPSDTTHLADTDDIYVSRRQILRFNLQTGDAIECELRMPRGGEDYIAMAKVERINGRAIALLD